MTNIRLREAMHRHIASKTQEPEFECRQPESRIHGENYFIMPNSINIDLMILTI
jgi:hypothetical protein